MLLSNMNLEYPLIFFTALLLSFLCTILIKKIAEKLRIFDKPGTDRKIHDRNIPLLGGLGIFVSFFVVIYFFRSKLLSGELEPSHWIGFFIGGIFLMIGGILDDKYELKPREQIIWPVLAIIALLAGGVNIEKITSPLGGFIYLDSIKFVLFSSGNITYYFVLLSDLLIFFWLIGMMYTTKLLDGLDGLVTGVTAIGSLIIFLFTMTEKYYQPDIGLAALILAGTCAGFLILNWNPAKIFLGEGGSLFLGYALGVLAIISGGKIAVALLIMGLPIMDVAWTILRRINMGKNPFKFADRKHLHFRLLDLGLGQKKTVLIYYFFACLFGLSAVFLQSTGKIFALIFLVLLMLVIVLSFNYLDRKKEKGNTINNRIK